MDKLLAYLNGLSKEERTAFCDGCETTEGYLRKTISLGKKFGEGLCIAIERESRGQVRCEDLRQDTDWAFIRGTAPRRRAAARAA
ncbi:helix-turn-helix domain-containing protein [Aquincola tertiaricarbonis]|uniref:Helix-turn-helix domain-containing protein n=1 Tax=Aquincola tertiaricarbonis TaxID=391953 RepID=A0ABY4SFZ9_AQUTE|nr:YdaS family helix-turn-helix protein [Aquincola tertiaricarbonis]URI11042.1 helix-turn-helix domain-containing protein [Aquincola tertiaricarbonis]